MSESELVDILLVEDDPAYANIVRDALSGVTPKVRHVEDGVEALAFLRQEGEYAHPSRPYLILLDLRLPKKSGLDVLTEIRQDPDSDLKRIPVIIMTGADPQQTNYPRLTELGITRFISKDKFDEKAFREVVKKMHTEHKSQMPEDAEKRIRGIISGMDL